MTLSRPKNLIIEYKEFSFSKNGFCPAPGESKEFADHVTWLDDLLIIYQLKERSQNTEDPIDADKKWFENKVVKKATRQIRDTLQFLQEYSEIELRNHRTDIEQPKIAEFGFNQ